jgi:hypothetical protein
MTVGDPIILGMLNDKLAQQYSIFENAIRTSNIDLVEQFLINNTYIDYNGLQHIPINSPIIIDMLNYYTRNKSLLGWEKPSV